MSVTVKQYLNTKISWGHEAYEQSSYEKMLDFN